jgi:hypothetical protein
MAVNDKFGLYHTTGERLLGRIVAAFESTGLQPTHQMWARREFRSDGATVVHCCGGGALAIDHGIDVMDVIRNGEPDLGIGGHERCLAAGWDNEWEVRGRKGTPDGCPGCSRRVDRCRFWSVGRAAAMAMGLP